MAVGVALLASACDPKPGRTPHDTGKDVGSLGLDVEVEVDGAVVFAGVADAPALGLHQPPREEANCLPSRRVSVMQGAAVFVDMVFPGEVPEVGAQVRFPAQPDSEAADWSAATWVDDGGQPWAAYGGLATLEAFGQDRIEMSLIQATVCRSDRVGRIDPLVDGTWSVHTSECQEAAEVVFRTMEALPFDLEQAPWCARGRARSWQTRDGEPLCSELTEPCEVE
jgi:hypothetical protein